MTAVTTERRRIPTDPTLFHATLALIAIGVVTVFDASYARSMDMGDGAFYYLKRQAAWAGLGILAMLLATRVGYWKLRGWAAPLLIVALVGLGLVWAPGIGITRNGAARWIGWGPVQVQPSEFAKLALALYLAALLARGKCNIRDFGDGLLAPLCIIGAFVVLVEREPDLGTAVVVFAMALTMLFFAGARKRHIAGIFFSALLLGILATMAFGHRTDRIKIWLDPMKYYLDEGYQVAHGLMAIGTSGLGGVGIGAGREKFYLPEANTDFIFAIIAEETGLWGILLVMGLLFVIGWRGLVIARRTRDPFGALLAAGIAAMISWQAIINMAVVSGSIPATGVPLPFMSYGGSSLCFLLCGIGILLNISQHPDTVKAEGAGGSRDSAGGTRDTQRVARRASYGR